ncbi:MAG: HlyC/CorC family transporter [Polyangiaceae bacterium]|nr:HlyC/CorC family transporter [Polyangiaceae bacterium]
MCLPGVSRLVPMLAGELTPGSTPHASALGLDPWVALLFALVLVAINGFFVAAEFALVKLRFTQIEPLVKAGERRAIIAARIAEQLDTYLSAIQLGITLASLALGWIGEPAFSFLVRPVISLVPGTTETVVQTVSATTAFLVITALHIVLGEVAPKSLAIRRPDATSLWVAIPLYGFSIVAYPAIWLLNQASLGVLRLVGVDASGHESVQSEDELRLLLASRRGLRLSAYKRQLLDNALELSHRTARQAMVPRADVAHVTVEQCIADAIAVSRARGYTRLPLCEGDLDHVIGFVHMKDLLLADPAPASLRHVRRDVLFIPEMVSLDRVLRRMRRRRVHLAVVVDEYGGTSGIVTLEDVIEQIVGPIQDEFDAEGSKFVRVAPGEYDVTGTILVADLEDRLGIDLDDRDEDTLGGVVMAEIGRLPRTGEVARVGPVEVEVRDVDGARIRRLRVRMTSPEEGTRST